MPRNPPPAAILRNIAELARLYGWRHHHGTPSPGALAGLYSPGFPTEVLARSDRLLFLVLGTSNGGPLGPAEQAWVDALSGASHVEVHVLDRRKSVSQIAAILCAEPRE